MAGKRPKPEEIVSILRQVEVLQGQGMSIGDAVRHVGITQNTYYTSLRGLRLILGIPMEGLI